MGVLISSWEGKQKEGFVRISEKFLLPLMLDVILHVPHKETKRPKKDEKFNIFIWSSPSGEAKTKPPEKIWGIDVDCRDSGFIPSGLGVPILDPDTGWVVAELVDENDLYIHHDLCHHGTANELKIFQRLCEEVVLLKTDPTEKVELERRNRQESRRAYVDECSQRLAINLELTRDQAKKGRDEIRSLQKKLVEKIRQTKEAENKLSLLETSSQGELEKYGREFDKTLNNPKVTDVQVTEGVIRVFTNTLFCVDPRSRIEHEIGKFQIAISTQSGDIRWHNLTRKIEGYEENMNAPHVFPSGKACLGSMEEIIVELVGNYEYAALIMVAIQFIETVNVDDSAGKHIDKWPVAKKSRRK